MPIRYAMVIVLATIMTFSVVWVRLKIVNQGYQIHELEQKEVALRNEISQLTYKVNQAKSPKNLESIAKNKFKMQSPDSVQIIRLSRSK